MAVVILQSMTGEHSGLGSVVEKVSPHFVSICYGETEEQVGKSVRFGSCIPKVALGVSSNCSDLNSS